MNPAFTFLLLILIGVIYAECPYSSLPSGPILVADSYCANAPSVVCGINNSCSVIQSFSSNDFNQFFGFNSIGDMSSYRQPDLTIMNSTSLTIQLMRLSNYVQALTFRNILSLDLSDTQAASTSTSTSKTITSPRKSTFPTSIVTMQFINCSIDIFPQDFAWPENLNLIVLMNNQLQTIPRLPSSVHELAIQGNAIQDLNYLPANLTFINLATNQIKQIVSMDWKHVTFLRLSRNPLTTFAFVQLSTELEYFNCNDCALTNITVDSVTYEALNALIPWDGNEKAETLTGYAINKRVATDPTKCSSIGGVIKPLWVESSKYSITACVLVPTTTPPLPTTIAPTTQPPKTQSTSNSTLIIGIVLGAVGIIGIAGALIILKRRRLQTDLQQDTNFHNAPQSLETNYAKHTEFPHNFPPSAPTVT